MRYGGGTGLYLKKSVDPLSVKQGSLTSLKDCSNVPGPPQFTMDSVHAWGTYRIHNPLCMIFNDTMTNNCYFGRPSVGHDFKGFTLKSISVLLTVIFLCFVSSLRILRSKSSTTWPHLFSYHSPGVSTIFV